MFPGQFSTAPWLQIKWRSILWSFQIMLDIHLWPLAQNSSYKGHKFCDMGSHKCPPDLGDPDQGMPPNPGVYEQSPLCQGLSGESCFLFVKLNVESTQKEPQETRESAQQGGWRKLVLLVQVSRSVISDFAIHGLQHARLPRPSPTPRAHSSEMLKTPLKLFVTKSKADICIYLKTC